jgi:hypothetical protein
MNANFIVEKNNQHSNSFIDEAHSLREAPLCLKPKAWVYRQINSSIFACRKRFDFSDFPPLQRKRFSVKEDMMIAKCISLFGKNWSRISCLLQNSRTPTMVKNRYYSYLRKNEAMRTLLFIVKDLEQAGPIELQDDEKIEDFHIFVSPVQGEKHVDFMILEENNKNSGQVLTDLRYI